MDLPEKRHWIRYKKEIKIFVTSTEEYFICQTIDISQGGMLISVPTEWQVDINEICHVFPIDEDESYVEVVSSIESIVVWSSLEHVGLQFEHDFTDYALMPPWLSEVLSTQ